MPSRHPAIRLLVCGQTRVDESKYPNVQLPRNNISYWDIVIYVEGRPGSGRTGFARNSIRRAGVTQHVKRRLVELELPADLKSK